MMEITIPAVNLLTKRSICLRYHQAEKCPICHTSIVAVNVSCALCSSQTTPSKKDVHTFFVTQYCPNCKSCFLTKELAVYEGVNSNAMAGYISYKVLSSEPVRFVPHTFNDKISALSPQFVEIYNQAKCAETQQLSHIAGMGYRKALEFLVKDYIIHFYPDDEEKVKNMPLAKCINTYIDIPKIKTLAEKATWIGNDETHYIRKHADKDVEDLKRFIGACVSYMDIELTYEEAEAIEKA